MNLALDGRSQRGVLMKEAFEQEPWQEDEETDPDKTPTASSPNEGGPGFLYRLKEAHVVEVCEPPESPPLPQPPPPLQAADLVLVGKSGVVGGGGGGQPLEEEEVDPPAFTPPDTPPVQGKRGSQKTRGVGGSKKGMRAAAKGDDDGERTILTQNDELQSP
ncbi:hypothetical protein Pcinc_042163 [Petrolisthes cinctipes]|uniref:Uncharacterized protein n=1 Tax=Petrolisthes cinctipes TaxID=88211 RepID=A0AAE1BKJ7_PETCI|nr:hypothetical protein Pcinc_042163 [Petrolisthes cinctipes]